MCGPEKQKTVRIPVQRGKGHNVLEYALTIELFYRDLTDEKTVSTRRIIK